MSNATKCDRCGGFFEQGGKNVRQGWGNMSDEYDLCPDCAESFDAWLERGQMADASEGIVMARVFGVDDTREQLEADVRKFAQVYYADHLLVHDKVIELLDRQAAITERELCAGCDWPEIAAWPDLEQLARTAEQDRRIVELSEELAKRDKGIDRLKRRRGELMEQLRRLTSEHVELTARIGELEAATSGLRENLAASASAHGAALAGLAAERDRYRAALGRVLDHVDGALREGLSATSGAD